MIITKTKDRYRLITQTDHAIWAYQLLKLWPDLQHHPRRLAILEATRLHDRGWQGVDASPLVDEQGRPHDFRSLPSRLRETVWRQGVAVKASKNDPTESVEVQWRELLICHHAWVIHHPDGRLLGRSGRQREELLPLASALTAERAERIEQLERALSDTEDGQLELRAESIEDCLALDYDWLGTLDFLSLIACGNWSESFKLTMPASQPSSPKRHFKAHGGDQSLRFAPYPLAGSYTIQLPCREIASRHYASNSDLSLELARARWQKLDIQVCQA